MTSANVKIFGATIGEVSWNSQEKLVKFAFDEYFTRSGVELSPLMLPLRGDRFSGAELPGLLQETLPRGFARTLLPRALNPVEKLLHIGSYGMGALEFQPTSLSLADEPLELDRLAQHLFDFLTRPQADPRKQRLLFRKQH